MPTSYDPFDGKVSLTLNERRFDQATGKHHYVSVEWHVEQPRPTFTNLVPGQGCAECDNPRGGPQHFGSPACQSRGLAASDGQGYRPHCSCDACY